MQPTVVLRTSQGAIARSMRKDYVSKSYFFALRPFVFDHDRSNTRRAFGPAVADIRAPSTAKSPDFPVSAVAEHAPWRRIVYANVYLAADPMDWQRHNNEHPNTGCANSAAGFVVCANNSYHPP